MIESRGGFRFVNEPRFGCLVGHTFTLEKLDGHRPVQAKVPFLVDNTHPTFAHAFSDLVMGNRLSKHTRDFISLFLR